ncbi:MAG: glycosyltransferase family 2 protein [Patescibacteria group bacterium]|jgi:GT2 family glycosyltransferase
MPDISIIIVTWNSIKYLPSLFNSIDIQSLRNFEVIVIDNGSSDNSVFWIEQNHPNVTIIRNHSNLGFAQANNQGIRLSKSPYVMLCNTDIVMSGNFIEQLYHKIKSDPTIGSVGGKLLKSTADLNNPSDSDIIDSTGIAIYRSRRAVDRGENERNSVKFSNSGEVFGISGALVMYQKAALNAAAYNDQYFDESFFSYKEDVDLAWRLQLVGYTSSYVASAVAIHARGAAMVTDLSDRGTIKNRQTKSNKVNYLSYRNHWSLLIKNERWINIFFNPFLVWYEIKKFIYLLLREPSSLCAIISFYRNFPQMLKKRAVINSKLKVSKNKLQKWFQ